MKFNVHRRSINNSVKEDRLTEDKREMSNFPASFVLETKFSCIFLFFFSDNKRDNC